MSTNVPDCHTGFPDWQIRNLKPLAFNVSNLSVAGLFLFLTNIEIWRYCCFKDMEETRMAFFDGADIDQNILEQTNPVFNTAKMTLFQLADSGSTDAAAIYL